ncbi:MAG TPA: ABC transporter ATP-binding protein [Nitrospirae bacterium]|nr:ABC transporter ATP-binding protein [Nitrospirota bacterium]
MIKIEDLHKSFGDKDVLRGVNLDVGTGESMVVIGGSGSGKSVLIKHIIGLLRPDRGRVTIDGVDISTLNEKELYGVRRRFGMLFQGAALFDSLTVWENVAFILLRHGRMSEDEARDVASAKLRLVGLTGVEDLMPSELSGGMRKRVGLARAIAHEPEIILYDEPTTGLDPIMADAINDLIIELREKLHVTSVTITHDMKSAYKIADRIAMLYEGEIIETGSPEEIRNTSNPVVRQFITGSAVGPIKIEGVTR